MDSSNRPSAIVLNNFEIWLDDGILRLLFRSEVFSKTDMIWMLEIVDELRQGQRLPLVTYPGKLRLVSREAMSYIARDEVGAQLAAVAAITDSSVTRMIGQLALQLYQPAFPVRLAYSEHEALQWVQQFRPAPPAS